GDVGRAPTLVREDGGGRNGRDPRLAAVVRGRASEARAARGRALALVVTDPEATRLRVDRRGRQELVCPANLLRWVYLLHPTHAEHGVQVRPEGCHVHVLRLIEARGSPDDVDSTAPPTARPVDRN